jgi:hypothetical protein
LFAFCRILDVPEAASSMHVVSRPTFCPLKNVI